MVFALVPVAAIVALLGSANALVTRATSLCPDGVNRVSNLACCAFIPIRDAFVNDVFEGECIEDNHSVIRIAFHDAAGFSIHGGKGGGADGSIITFGSTELAFAANGGIDDIVSILQPFADSHGLSYGDAIQFGSSIALALCPGAPRVQTFVGRKNATVAAPDKTLPEPQDNVTSILARFSDMGFSAAEAVALLASHSVAAQDVQDASIPGSPFDSTPEDFDSQVFLEVLLKGTAFPGNGQAGGAGESLSPMAGEFRLQSDFAMARDPRTACIWQSFVSNQALMAQKFGSAMAKLGLLGQNPNALHDCTELIPIPAPAKHSKAFFPAGKTIRDIEAACSTAAFPRTLSTQAGTATAVPPVPTQ